MTIERKIRINNRDYFLGVELKYIKDKILIIEYIRNFLDKLVNILKFNKIKYPIKICDIYNYINLLLYNIKYKCYVAVELKVTELKKEHTG